MNRRVIVNGRFLSRRITGVERYGREILSLIQEEYHVAHTRFNGVSGHLWEQFILPTRLPREYMLWSPANTGPLFVRNQALTIHDLSPLEHPEWFQKNFSRWYRLFLPILAKQVQTIFTPSVHVKHKVAKRFGVNNVIVTRNAVDPSVFHPNLGPPPIEFPRKYILFVGSIQPRKNLAGLMQAWHGIKDNFKDIWLVIAGEAGHVFRGIKFFGDERIRFLGYVPDSDLPALYSNAELFVLPSFDEGFGLPVLEAMACGTPVLTSNGGALPEIVADAGIIFDLEKPEGLSQAMKEILSNPQLRSSLKEKGPLHARKFSWHSTAELVLNKLKHPEQATQPVEFFHS